jgi:Collagen triple helix repeat (20 copies)
MKAGTEGLEGKEGPAGAEGSTGSEGPRGSTGAEGPKGVTGSTGPQRRKSPAGVNAALGAQGPVGPAGPSGSAGPAGKVELVTCKTVKQRRKSVQRCTTKLVSSTVTFTATGPPRRRRSRVTVRCTPRGRLASRTGASISLRLLPVRRPRGGRYTLTLVAGSGAHGGIRSESFTLIGARRRHLTREP